MLSALCSFYRYFLILLIFNVIIDINWRKTMNDNKNIINRIIIDPKIRFGKPCIVGTRITVPDVLELVQEGIPFNEIITKYFPDLTIDDVKMCVRYATQIVSAEEVFLGNE